MTAYHNSRMPLYRRPFGAAVAGSPLFLAVQADAEAEACTLLLAADGKAPDAYPMARSGSLFSVSLTLPAAGCLMWYTFRLSLSGGKTVWLGCAQNRTGGESTLSENEDVSPYQITVYEKSATPDWFKNGIVYQIFPDSFARGRDFPVRLAESTAFSYKSANKLLHMNWSDLPFYGRDSSGRVIRWPFYGGTLEGIREKLPYLEQLGVTVVYLNPIFMASSCHRYDTADYMRIDPLLGTEDDFRRLMQDGRQHGIRFILDGVFSHTGADSRYFNRYGTFSEPGACTGPSSPCFSWYSFEHFPDRYSCWWGVDDLPEVDETQESYADFICGENGVIRKWLRLGASGWRLDVADELPDSFIQKIRAAMDAEDPESLLLGEVWEDASNKISYGCRRAYFLGHELHATMNYPFRDCAIRYTLGQLDAPELGDTLMSLMENYPPENFYGALNLIGSHDRTRILTVLGDQPEPQDDMQRQTSMLPPDKLALAKRRLELLSLLQFTVPGVPCIYYGDEAGMQGFSDPYNRGSFPWGREDPALSAHYRQLTALRQAHPVLTGGSFSPVPGTAHVFAFTRSDPDETLLILINRGIFEHEPVDIPPEYAETILSLHTGAPAPGPAVMEPLSALILKKHGC